MVAADVEPVAELDRRAAVSTGGKRRRLRARARSPWSGARASAGRDAVRPRDLVPDVSSAVGASVELATSARPSGLYAGLGVGHDDGVDQPPAGLAQHDQRRRPGRRGQHVADAWSPGAVLPRRRRAGGAAAVAGSVATTTASARHVPRVRVDAPGRDAATGVSEVQRVRGRAARRVARPTACMPCAGSPIAPRTKLRQQQVQVAAGGRQLGLEQDAGEERTEEALHRGRRPTPARRSASSAVRSGAAAAGTRAGRRPGARRRRARPSRSDPPSGAVSVSGTPPGRWRGSTTRWARPSDPEHGAAARTSRGRARRGRGPRPADSRCSAPGSRGRRRSRRCRSVASRPPACSPASSTCTSQPAACRRTAADSPARPAPTTTTSARAGMTSADGSLARWHGGGRPGGGLWTTPAGRPARRPTVAGMTAAVRRRARAAVAAGRARLHPGGPARPRRLRRGLAGGSRAAAAPPVAVKVLVAGDPERQAREAALLGELDHPHLVRLIEVVHQPRRRRPARVSRSSWNCSPAAASPRCSPGAAGCGPARWSPRSLRSRPPSRTPTTTASSTATSRRATSSSPPRAGRCSPTWAWPGSWARRRPREVTPAYVDPTVARGGAPGPASDVFGVAAAAFHALTGVAPWNAATPGRHPRRRRRRPAARPGRARARRRRRRCSPSSARGLAADPHDRGSAAAFALDLRHACRPEPVRLPADGVPGRRARRHRPRAPDGAHPPGAGSAPHAAPRRRRGHAGRRGAWSRPVRRRPGVARAVVSPRRAGRPRGPSAAAGRPARARRHRGRGHPAAARRVAARRRPRRAAGAAARPAGRPGRTRSLTGWRDRGRPSCTSRRAAAFTHRVAPRALAERLRRPAARSWRPTRRRCAPSRQAGRDAARLRSRRSWQVTARPTDGDRAELDAGRPVGPLRRRRPAGQAGGAAAAHRSGAAGGRRAHGAASARRRAGGSRAPNGWREPCRSAGGEGRAERCRPGRCP